MAKKNDPSEMGKKGGKARAKSLTPERRSEIARNAALARHGSGVPEATHTGEMQLGNAVIECSVLEDGTRLISQRGLAKAFDTAVPSGSRREDNLPAFLSSKSLKPFISKGLISKTAHIKYKPKNGGVAHGIPAEAIPMICDVWLEARDSEALAPSQQHIAEAADIIMRGLAHVGIVALVDEATGYQRAREQDALAKILEQFIAKELQKWVSTFPLRFYELICEVRDEPIERAKKRPQYLGTITNDLVYERLAPGVLEQLKNSNPVAKNGGRKHKHHQFLTTDMGHPKLREHLAKVITVLDIARLQGLGWDGFKNLLDNTVPKQPEAPLFQYQDDD